jgi:hypothetical protein
MDSSDYYESSDEIDAADNAAMGRLVGLIVMAM